jgi:hypothetical protein
LQARQRPGLPSSLGAPQVSSRKCLDVLGPCARGGSVVFGIDRRPVRISIIRNDRWGLGLAGLARIQSCIDLPVIHRPLGRLSRGRNTEPSCCGSGIGGLYGQVVRRGRCRHRSFRCGPLGGKGCGRCRELGGLAQFSVPNRAAAHAAHLPAVRLQPCRLDIVGCSAGRADDQHRRIWSKAAIRRR